MENGRIVVIIATSNSKMAQSLEESISKLVPKAVLYFAHDGASARMKAENTPPHLFFTDFDLAKVSLEQLINAMLTNRRYAHTRFILLGAPPKREIYLDELVTGKVQFLHNAMDEGEVGKCLTKALSRESAEEKAEFSVRHLEPGELLMKAGDKADNVYILKSGQLNVFITDRNGKRVDLGKVEKGEFVGEMSYISGETRSANVEAAIACELIEIPIGTLDKLLYHRPAWSKTLLTTLSKRLKTAGVSPKIK